MGTPSQQSAFVAPKAVAAHLGVSIQTVYGLIERGDLPAVRVGKQYRIAPQDVDTLLARGKSAG